jgi:serine/threonine protein kinase
MELVDTDLHRIIQSSQSLSNEHIVYFMWQLLCGLQFLHQHKVLHRDLKPGNLLVSKRCELRIADFGLARVADTAEGMTEHVVTRWYRPPELMLSPDGRYNESLDVWSVGCILGELLQRKPLFPGKDFIDQLTLILNVIGTPDEDEKRYIQVSIITYIATPTHNRRTTRTALITHSPPTPTILFPLRAARRFSFSAPSRQSLLQSLNPYSPQQPLARSLSSAPC